MQPPPVALGRLAARCSAIGAAMLCAGALLWLPISHLHDPQCPLFWLVGTWRFVLPLSGGTLLALGRSIAVISNVVLDEWDSLHEELNRVEQELNRLGIR
ncbi:hypothetical protein HGI30_19355 [Paenibacillus albicereus]|uniref:Uncharacterized protein n=1 Tax=Paenibacillus albicereus TaxID=2726185 RepID=A0A6H2H1F1_9BACL|nr:hypothetical protein [Paenibacillus albicereus]QJC53482.1 hypothetical protein HGI30_19355 [Paenibacillus albicereus]